MTKESLNVAAENAVAAAASSSSSGAAGSGSSGSSGAAGSGVTPPALTGLVAVGSFGAVNLSWNNIPYGDHAYTNIYRYPSSTLGVYISVLNVDGIQFDVYFDVLGVDGAVFTISSDVLDTDGNVYEVKSQESYPIGTSRSLVYVDSVPASSNYYYWIRAVSTSGIEGPLNQVAGTLGSASLDPAYTLDMLIGQQTDPALHRLPLVVGNVGGVEMVGLRGEFVVDGTITGDSIHADAIGANHISVENLSALSGNMGVLTTGLIKSPDHTFYMDMAAKEIMISGPNGQAADDYMVLRNGVIEAWKWIAGQHVLGKALTHIESGTANSNTTVQIPGYFESEPAIQVSPRNIQVYSAAYPTQNQTLECKATSITEYATGQWQFYAYSALTLAAGGGTQTVNWQNGSTSSNTINSAVQVTPANVTDFDVWVGMRSFRGTGTAPNYYYRKVDLILYYRAVGSGAWIAGDTYSNFYLPADIENFYGYVLAVSGLPADDYEFYVNAVYSDQSPPKTFSSGSGGYEYDSYTTPISSAYQRITANEVPDNKTATVTANLSSYTPPSGWGVYNVTYFYKEGSFVAVRGSTTQVNEAQSTSLFAARFVDTPGPYASSGTAGAPVGSQKSFTSGSYSTTAINGTIRVESGYTASGGLVMAEAEGRFSDAYAVIDIRKALANSTTPSNDLKIVSFDYETGASTELSGGSLNWMAVGR